MRIAGIYDKVAPLRLGTPLPVAVTAMLAANCDFLPVTDEQGEYCGVVSWRGLLLAMVKKGGEAVIYPETKLPTAPLDSDVEELPLNIDRLVVVDARNHDRVVGVVTSARLLACTQDFFLAWGKEATRDRDSWSPPVNYTYDLLKKLASNQEAIFESSYDGIFISDGHGVVMRLNEAYERITGIKASQVVGRNMADLVDDYYDQSVTLLVLHKRQRVTINQLVKPTHKHVLATGNPIFDEAGEISLIVVNVRDVIELTNLQRALQKTRAETLRYQTELTHLRSLQLRSSNIIYRSKAMEAVLELAVKVATVNSTVLISGESGTGKELVAKFIHRQGKGLDRPFIQVNCGAIPETLLESELFGYERGAFTGARKEGKPGLFELAHNGTLFLDEIGEMPMSLQVKLLRVIQEKTVTRLGGTSPQQIDVRIIAATNRNLAAMVKDGAFREDLYYRLMVVPIKVPPLRERREDIPLLVMHFVKKFNEQFGYNKRISPQIIERLMDYSWPGNVRELENMMERITVTSTGDDLTVYVLPVSIVSPGMVTNSPVQLKEAVAFTEKVLLTQAWRKYGTWQKAAQALGVDRTTAFRKAVKYGLVKNSR